MALPGMTAEIIIAAIEGFEVQKRRIDEQIAELRQALSGLAGEGIGTPAKRMHGMSAAGRQAIAEAQRKRWAAAKASKDDSAPTVRPKRKLSKAGRAAIVAALKKRWAAKKAAAAGS